MSDPYRSHRPAAELKADPHPNVAERVVRSVMHVVAIVLMTLTALLVLSVVHALGRIGDAVDQIRAPEPTVTECVGELC